MAATKLTRSQVARMLGVTTKTLYTWEKEGRAQPPERDWRGWRWYTTEQVEALRRLMASGMRATPPAPAIASSEAEQTSSERTAAPMLDVSARNRLVGTIVHISPDGVLAEVILDLGGGNEIVSVITRASVERLGLRVGARAVALIKATEVLLAREA